jgi:hypothetical protein
MGAVLWQDKDERLSQRAARPDEADVETLSAGAVRCRSCMVVARTCAIIPCGAIKWSASASALCA